MTKNKFCRDCKFSKPEERSEWNLRCINDLVAESDAWSLSALENKGTDCRLEREKPWLSFPACGKAGKLFEAKS